LAAALLGLSLWLNSSRPPALSDLPAEVVRDLATTSTRNSLLAPLVWMVIFQVFLAAVEFVSILLLVPGAGQPNTVAYDSTQDYRGFGHPTQLFARIPDLALPLEWQGFKNRWRYGGNETPTATVDDVGSFQGTIFVEQQPRPLAGKYGWSATLLLLAGWGCLATGMSLFLFFLLPGPLRQLAMETARYPQAPVFLLFMMILGIMASGNGRRYLRQGRALLESAQFHSHAILMDVVGTLSRADVRVGKSLSDSIESSSVIARSDFTVRFWAGELVSEIGNLRNPDDRRALLGLNLTPENQHWIEHFRCAMQRLREEGIRLPIRR
jgi:hypothetical protein